jgi:uncharacterized protein (TIRG00374 family)
LELPKNFIRQLIICVLASVVFYGVWVIYTGWDVVWAVVVRLGFMGWAIILGLSVFNYGMRFVRWQLYLNKLGYAVPPIKNLGIYLAGFAFTATPGKVGEAIRSVYLHRYKVKYTDSIAVFFVERFMDVIAMVMLSMLAAFSLDNAGWLVFVVGGIVLISLPLIRSERAWAFADRLRLRFGSEKFKSLAGHGLNMLRSSAVLLRSGTLYGGLLIGSLAWAAEGAALWVVLDHMGADVPLLLAAGIYGISILAGAVSFVPGGLGSTEIVMGILLIAAGVDQPLAVSAVLICRIATLWFAVAIGLGFAVELETRSKPVADAVEELEEPAGS